jgi:hypothetical protein
MKASIQSTPLNWAQHSPGTSDSNETSVEASTAARAELIIDEASHLWRNVLLSLVLVGPGLACLAPWYLLYLLQWKFLAKRNPGLITPNLERKSLPSRYQRARVRLLIGFWFGIAIWLLAATSVAIVYALE